MTLKGTGRRAWREQFPADEWETVRHFTVFGIKYVLFRKRTGKLPLAQNTPAAVLSFDASEGMIDWEIVGRGAFVDVEKTFMEMKHTLGGLTEDPAKTLTQHPDYARF